MSSQDTPLEQFGIFASDPEAPGCVGVADQDGWAFVDLGNDEVGIRCVTMEPGRHSKWHVHENGAHVIVCLAGKAWVQVEGEEPQALTPGKSASVAAGVKHWHGAAKDSRAQILIVHACPQGLAHDFQESVDEEAYNAL